MKVLLLVAIVISAMDMKCASGKQNCLQSNLSNSNNYTNLLAGNNNPLQLNKMCEENKCIALMNKQGSRECKESCPPRKSINEELISLLDEIKKNKPKKGSSERPRTASLGKKTITSDKEERFEREPVTFFKTEIKTVTVDVEDKEDQEECVNDCVTKRKQNKRKKPARKHTKKRSIKEDSQMDSECSSTCREQNQEVSEESDYKVSSHIVKSSEFSLAKEPATSMYSRSKQDVTVTQVIEKTKTVEKPMTLFREMMTTITVEKPIINYKVTTFTKFSTMVESITITKVPSEVDGAEVPEYSRKPITYKHRSTRDLDSQEYSDSTEKTTTKAKPHSRRPEASISKIDISKTLKPETPCKPEATKTVYLPSPTNSSAQVTSIQNIITVPEEVSSQVQPKTVTIFTNTVKQEPSIITITKEMETPPKTELTVVQSQSKPAVSLVNTIFSTVTVMNTTQPPNSTTVIIKTVTRNVEYSSMPISVETVRTEVPPSSIIETITKIVSRDYEIEPPKKSVQVISTVTITEKVKESEIEEKTTTAKTVKHRGIPEILPAKTTEKVKYDCNEIMECLKIPQRYPKKIESKTSSNLEITKAIPKGCEVTKDEKRKKPRTVCRFVNVSSKAAEPMEKVGRKKRTVFKTVFEDEDSAYDNTVTKTVFA